jgi:MFS family permease
VTVALIVGRIYLSILNGDMTQPAGVVVDAVLDLLGLGFLALGLLVVHRRPGNPVGWIILGIGVAAAATGFLQSYGIYALFTEPGRIPGGEMTALLSTLIFIPVLFAAPAMLFLLFPNGNLPGRRWRVVFWLVILTTCSAMAGNVLNPTLNDAPFKGVDNPLVVDPPRALFETLSNFGWPGMTASFLLAAFAMIVRLRRSRGVERQQLKWIAAAAAVLPLASAAGVVSYYLGYEAIGGLLATFSFLPVLFAAGYAVLRYRLYDIDVIINRTLVYGLLTASLALVYFGGVTGLQRLLVPVVGQDGQLAIVASTLAIAALFNPLRRRIQEAVDRRFYRRKYDARKTLEEFGVKLRDETDLQQLNAELVGVVRETMQPEHVSLWLRRQEETGSR